MQINKNQYVGGVHLTKLNVHQTKVKPLFTVSRRVTMIADLSRVH